MAEQPRGLLGYDDTPYISGSKYRVHDSTRPQPVVVTPGTESSQSQPGRVPSDAIVLFSGTSLESWHHKDGSPARWKVENGCMEVTPRTGNIITNTEFGDCQLHLEWAAPSAVAGQSQGRGNSGVFLMGRYEVQVLDCYNNPTYADGTTGAIYGQYPPLVNACRKPGEWQTYDIVWEAPRWDGDKLVSPAYLTLFHNGVLLHNHRALLGPTTHRAVLPYAPHPSVGPLELQDHGNPMRFRNIWYRPLVPQDV
ncbi:MAG: DUF1080 domain-containing protein [Chloroflexi bacterium]|nr:DUF1080 domain-containing protein [Chloroflexota bacterium]